MFIHVNEKQSDNYGNMISFTPIVLGFNMITARHWHHAGYRKHWVWVPGTLGLGAHCPGTILLLYLLLVARSCARIHFPDL